MNRIKINELKIGMYERKLPVHMKECNQNLYTELVNTIPNKPVADYINT
jgi:hypothetical protein